jgi:hypothetical protein
MQSVRARKRHPGKVRPLQGNAPHDRPVSRGISFVKGAFATIPKVPLLCQYRGASVCVFEAWRNLSVRCWPKAKPNPGTGAVPPPAGRPRTRVKERAGRITPFSSSAMSSGRLFLDRVGRHQSPSPLHRRPQNNMQSVEPPGKGDISTLLGRGHFYFALTDACATLLLTCPMM